MVRSFACTALVLRVRPSGESNRDAWFLGAGEGVLRATVFGGPKSRLRSHVAPFHRGRLWLYHNPVRDSRKVTDFDVEAWRPGIRESWERTMAADAAAETILASQGGGGAWDQAFGLGDRTLQALEGAAEPDCLPIFLRFLWEWADLLGCRPELRCAACGADAETLWYSPREGGFLCRPCAGAPESGGLLPLGPAARRWLAAADAPPPAAPPLRELRAALTGMMAQILGRRPGTWDLI
jgi:DNA repair protein RecO (recombination protein O)